MHEETMAVLRSNLLFRGLTEQETKDAAAALKMYEKRFHKNERILSSGSVTDRLGVILSGSVTIESCDVWGNSTILSHAGAGDLFAETYALLPGQVLLVDVVANTNCRIAFLRPAPLLGDGPAHASKEQGAWRSKMLRNLLQVSLRKNLTLSNRSFQTAPKTIRGRVLAYLSAVSLETNARSFDIPFDRQQLADYLNVERTALSKELGKMQKDGILRCRRSHFELLDF